MKRTENTLADDLASGRARISVEIADNGDATETVTRAIECPDGGRLILAPKVRAHR